MSLTWSLTNITKSGNTYTPSTNPSMSVTSLSTVSVNATSAFCFEAYVNTNTAQTITAYLSLTYTASLTSGDEMTYNNYTLTRTMSALNLKSGKNLFYVLVQLPTTETTVNETTYTVTPVSCTGYTFRLSGFSHAITMTDDMISLNDINLLPTKLKRSTVSEVESVLSSISGQVSTNALGQLILKDYYDILKAQVVEAEEVIATKVDTETLEANYLDANTIQSNYAHITSGVIDNAKIDYADVNNLSTNYAHLTNGVIDNATIGYADVDNLSANYAQINGANVTDLTAQNAWVNKILVNTGLIAQEGQIYTLDAIQVNASNITAGTLDVERLIVTVDDEKYLVHFDTSGSTTTTTYEKLDGGIIEDSTITADKILANTITVNKITTNNLEGTNGWINLHEGKFSYTHNGATWANTTNGIEWDGTNLKIKGAIEVTSSSSLYTQNDIDTMLDNYALETNAISKEQLIYKSATIGTTSMNGTTTWVSDATGRQAIWTIVRPEYDKDYPVLFVATQRQTVDGTVTCTTPVIDKTTTVIDGGNIISYSITATQIAGNTLTIGNINTSDSSTANSILNSTIAVGGRNLARHTSSDWKSQTLTDQQNKTIYLFPAVPAERLTYYTDLTKYGLKVGDVMQVSFDIKFSSDITATGTGTKQSYIQGNKNVGGTNDTWASLNINGGNKKADIEAIIASTSKEGHISTYFNITSDMLDGTYTGHLYMGVRFDYYTGTVYVRNVMLEKASTPSNWSPAPEDVAENTELNSDNMLLDWNAPSITRVNAKYDRYFSDSGQTTVSTSIIQITDPPESGINYGFQAVNSGSNTSATYRALCFYSATNGIPLTAGETYTATWWGKVTSGSATTYAHHPNGAGGTTNTRNNLYTLTSNWKQFTETFTVTALNTNYNRIWFYGAFSASTAGTVQLCGFKLRAGTSPEEASKVANNYISTDSSGLMVADLTSGVQTPSQATGKNVLIGSSSVDIRNGQTVLASYGTNSVINNLYAQNAYVEGEVEATSGSIADWDITDAKIYGGDSTTKVAFMQVPQTTTDWVFGAGGTSHSDYSDCTFKVHKDGRIYSSKGAYFGEDSDLYVGTDTDQTWNGGNSVQSISDVNPLTIAAVDSSSLHGTAIEMYNTSINPDIGEVTNFPQILFYGTRFRFGFGYASENIYLQPRIVGGVGHNNNIGSSNYPWTTVYATNTSIQTSDRKKKDILGSIDFAEDLIMNLKPVEYMWKDGNHRRSRMGFVAQDVAEICNDLEKNLSLVYATYKEDDEKDYFGEKVDDDLLNWSLSYGELIAPMVAVIQKQQKEIDELKELVNKLVSKENS